MSLFSKLFRKPVKKPVLVLRFSEKITAEESASIGFQAEKEFPEYHVVLLGPDTRIAIDGQEILPPSPKQEYQLAPINLDYSPKLNYLRSKNIAKILADHAKKAKRK